MVLPQTYAAVLALMLLGAIAQGSWANTLKQAGERWRFELYYFDFAVAAAAAALLCGFTFGNLGFDGFTLIDDFVRAGKRQWVFALVAGALFNLGNLLLAAAISVTAMAVAYPLAMGIAILLIAAWMASVLPGNAVLLASGFLLMLLAAALSASACSALTKRRAIKPLSLCAGAGLLMGASCPLFDASRGGEVGLGPYSAAVLFTAGMLCSTLVYDLFFMNLPVAGEPLELLDYVRGGPWVHRFGVIGGAVWCIGLVAVLAASGAPPEAHVRNTTALLAAQGSAIAAALWGLLLWKELAHTRAAARAWAATLAYSGGLAALALAFALRGK